MALPGPLTLYPRQVPLFLAGRHLIDGDAVNVVAAMVGSNDSAITATAGGGRANAYNIKAAMSQIAVAATAADSVVLPKSFPGMRCVILNNGASSVQVFANNADTINAIAGATGIALPANSCFEFVCVVAGNWRYFTNTP